MVIPLKHRLSLLFALLSLLIFAVPSFGQPQDDEQARGQRISSLLSTLRAGTGKEAPRLSRTGKGFIRFLGAPPGGFFRSGAATTQTAETAAERFLSGSSDALMKKSPAARFRVKRIRKSAHGRSFVRFNQTYGGIPVFGAETIVQVGATGGIESAISTLLQDLTPLDTGKIPTKPTISSAAARTKAIQFMAASAPKALLTVTTPELMVFDPALITGSGADLHLVWKTIVTATDDPAIGEQVFVDAHDGSIVFHFSLVMDAKNREIYDASNVAGVDPGTLVRSEGQGPSSIADVNACYNYFSDTYDFYLNYHGRDSIDGLGYLISGTVRFLPAGQTYYNAFWQGSRIYFGNAYASADDIVAHEFTHGVTQHESNLLDVYQPGAINESLSDMWGEWVDLTNGRGLDTPQVRWLIGEECPDEPPLRNMKNPPSENCAEIVGGQYWHNGIGDNGGIHNNSGVGNKLCYLLTDGGAFNGQTVTGMGIPTVASLVYECQTNLLTQTSNYADFADALAQAAINLGFTAAQRSNVDKACLAVGMKLPSISLGDALDSPLAWTASGDMNWYGQTTTKHDGTDAAQSGQIGDGQNTVFQTTINGPGQLSFWWRVSSQSGDYLRFSIDDTKQSGPISGSPSWARKSYSLSAGTHTLKWTYTKDGSKASGSDCGWVDNVVWTPTSPRGEITPADSIAPGNDLQMPFGSIPVGQTRGEFVLLVNDSASNPLTVNSISLLGSLYSEDLQDGQPQSWTFDNAGNWGVVNGELRASPTANGFMSAVYGGASWSNFSAQVTCRSEGGNVGGTKYAPPSYSGALVARATDDFDAQRAGSGYVFETDGYGSYRVWKQINGSSALLQPWSISPQVRIGANDLRATANGNRLSFYINGGLVWSGKDSSFPSGRVGVTGYAENGKPTHFFDNIMVGSPASTAQGGSAFRLGTLPTFPLTLGPGRSYRVGTFFRPTHSGPFIDTLFVSGNDLDEPVVAIQLSGNGGTNGQPPTPKPTATPTPFPIRVTNISRSGYSANQLREGSLPYLDQTYTFTSPIPSKLLDRIYIRTKQADKDTTTPAVFLSFDVNQGVAVYVGIDQRITVLPSWLKTWKKETGQLKTSDLGSAARILYSKKFQKGEVSLGSNRDSSMPKGRSMYTVVILPDLTGAEDWTLYSQMDVLNMPLIVSMNGQ